MGGDDSRRPRANANGRPTVANGRPTQTPCGAIDPNGRPTVASGRPTDAARDHRPQRPTHGRQRPTRSDAVRGPLSAHPRDGLGHLGLEARQVQRLRDEACPADRRPQVPRGVPSQGPAPPQDPSHVRQAPPRPGADHSPRTGAPRCCLSVCRQRPTDCATGSTMRLSACPTLRS